MSAFRTFPRGGIHPHSIGLDTLEIPVRNAFLPHTAYIPLSQHIGAPAIPVVQAGDKVDTGDLIGKASGYVSVNIHSSMPGTVVDIIDAPGPGNDRTKMVVIQFEGYVNIKKELHDRNSWRQYTSAEIIKTMQESGLVGLGGACFPMHVKYSVPKDKKINTLIINAVECEPFLSADYRLMMEYPLDILTGIEIAQSVLGVHKVAIGIEADTPAAIALMQETVRGYDGIEVVPLKVKYPQGAEKQLIKAVTGREVPSGGLPMDAGAVVSNVGTMFALKEAVVDKKPLYERIVTVTGNILERPGNYKIRIGTRIQDLYDEIGLKETPGKIIMGGPMMGQAQFTGEVPVVKGTSGLLFLSKKEAKRYRHMPCVRCGKCLEVCPMGLDPTGLVTAIELGEEKQLKADGLMDCIECGCCSYICPSQRHLAQGIKLGKLREAAKRKEAADE